MRLPLLLLTFLFAAPAHGQVDGRYEIALWAETEVGLEMWPNAHRTYQNQYQVKARGGISVGRWSATGYFNSRIWQTADAQVVGSPLNAEASMNIASDRGATVSFTPWRSLYVGPSIHRTQISVVWRFKDDNGYRDGWGSFDGNPNWEGRERRCRNEEGCGSIAYHEQIGIALGWRSGDVLVSARYLFWRYKQLTLAPTPLRLRARYRGLDGWEVRTVLYRDLEHRWRGHVALKRRIYKRLWVQLRAARAQPDHKEAFSFVGLGVLIR